MLQKMKIRSCVASSSLLPLPPNIHASILERTVRAKRQLVCINYFHMPDVPTVRVSLGYIGLLH